MVLDVVVPAPASVLAMVAWITALAAGLREVDVEQFGCKPDGAVPVAACTAGFKGAIRNISSSGGGTVNCRGPGAYIVAGVEMLSDVTLVVHAGASINASTVLEDWRPRRMVLPPCAAGEPAELEHGVLGGLFYASVAHNFTIRGPGAVNGAAKAWNKYGVSDLSAADEPPNPYGLIRSNMFVFALCTDVVVEDLQIQVVKTQTLPPELSMSGRRHIARGG